MEFCPDCQYESANELAPAEYTFIYGSNMLKATFPVWQCENCGYMFTDYRAEEAREEAINIFEREK
jgi:rubredoxin